MSLAALLGVSLAHLLAAISPGPSFVLSVRVAAAEGFRPAAALALGFGLGALVWATAALLGLALVFELVPPVFLALKLAGGAFLVWLGIAMWRHAPDPVPAPRTGRPPTGAGAAIRLGLATMIANPKPAIFFGAVFVGLVPATADAGDRALVLANILWVETAWYVVVAWAFSRARPRAAYIRAKTRIDRAMGACLGGLGLAVALR